MLFRYKIKGRYYSADIPKEDFPEFLEMSFSDKMKYIKNMNKNETKNEDEEEKDYGYSVLGTKKEKLKSETIEQLQFKEKKRLIAQKKMKDLKSLEDSINDMTKKLESNPDAKVDDDKLKKLEKLLEQKDTLTREIKSLNVDNIAVLDVQNVDTLNIKGLNKLVSDLNVNNITDTFNIVKKEVEKVYDQFLNKEMKEDLNDMMEKYKNILDETLNTVLNKPEVQLFSVFGLLSDKFKKGSVYKGNHVPAIDEKGNVLCVFNDFDKKNKLQKQPAMILNSLLSYNPNSENYSSVIEIISWENKTYKEYPKFNSTVSYTLNQETRLKDTKNFGEIFTLGQTPFIIPVEGDDPKLKDSLEAMVNKLARHKDFKNLEKLKTFCENIKEFKNFKGEVQKTKGYEEKQNKIEVMKDELFGILDNTMNLIEETKVEDSKTDKENDEEVGEGIISDIKNAPKKIKKLESKLEALEQMIKEKIIPPAPVVKETEQKPQEDKANVFKIPELKHVETVKREPEDEFKDLKEILNKRRKDIEYTDDEDDVSEDWEDSYTELTAGSLTDATELIDTLMDKYNIILRMYINRKKGKK